MNKHILFLSCLLAATLSITSLSAREVSSFNDNWQFLKGACSNNLVGANKQWNRKWQKVTLPHTWNATDMQRMPLVFYEGEAYYRKEYTAAPELKGKRIYLKFEGVGSCTEVYVNDELVGTHKGAYSAFVCEITGALRYGQKNTIVVKADNSARPDVIPVNHHLFGVYGGIYRPVWLIVTEPNSITLSDLASPGVYITQKNVSAKRADIQVKVKLDNGSLQPTQVQLQNTLYTQEGKQIVTDTQDILLTPQGMQSYTSHFTIRKPHLWQGRPDPYLYKVVTQLKQDGKVIDEVIQPLGIRHYHIVAGDGFYLNGQRYPMYGVTRHQDREGKGSALSKADHDEDLAMIMDIGATTIRLAHYQQSDYFYSRCDSLGLIVWAEIPFVNRVTGQERENAHSQMRELIRQSFNHPSIYCWGTHNEVYTPHQYTSMLTRELHEIAKTEDPDRYTASVNGYGHANHPVNFNTDIQGMNRYFGWYERKLQDMETWVQKLEKEYPHQILMLTEYGAGGVVHHQGEQLGDAMNPWGGYYPETFHTKLHEYSYSIIAQHPYIVASYFWNMFDFAVPTRTDGIIPARNMKGMITFDRKIKKDAYYFYKANWNKDPMVYLCERRYTQRERKQTHVNVYSNIGTPKVYLNGEELMQMHKGYTDIHYIFDATLQDGANTVTTVAVGPDGKEYRDQVKWYYAGEGKRTQDNYVNDNDHYGL